MSRILVDSGVNWLGKIPSSWSMCRVKNNFLFHKIIAKEKSVNYDRIALTLNGVIKRDKDDSNGLQPDNYDGYQIVYKDDLIFKLIDLENVNTSRIGKSEYEGITSPAYIILTDRCNTRYSLYYFLNMWYQEIFNNIGGDGVRSAINKDDLLKVPFLTIPLNEQIKIANYLDKQCTKIEEIISDNNREIELLEEYKSNIITNQISKYPKVKMKFILAGIKDGTHGSYMRVNDGELLLSSKNLSENGVTISDNESMISEDDYLSIISNGFPQKGDILFCSVGNVGKTCLYDFEKSYAFQRSVTFLRTNKLMKNKLLLYNTKSSYFKNNVAKSINKAIQDGLYMNQIKELKVFLPDIVEQDKIIKYLDKQCSKLDSVIEYRKQIIEKLEEYKKSLIYECVTGKREV